MTVSLPREAVDGAFCVSRTPHALTAPRSSSARSTPPRKGARPAFNWTPKRAQFVEEYLVDLNGTEAAIRAGFTPGSARFQASRLLARDEVRAAVDAARAERAERTRLTADWVLERAGQIVERCLEAAPVLVRRDGRLVQLTDAEGRHVWQFDAAGALGGLNLVGKHLGMFTQKVEVTGKDGGPIDVDVREVRERIADRLARLAPPAVLVS